MATLTGRSALVTGASRGIGAAIAKRLGKEGAEVAITYSSSPERAQQVVKEITDAGGRARSRLTRSTRALYAPQCRRQRRSLARSTS